MPTVTDQDYPHGLLCMDCDTPLPTGSAYIEKPIGSDWITATCVDCG